jgi:hypothetical protein
MPLPFSALLRFATRFAEARRARGAAARRCAMLMPILPFFIAYACFSPPLPDYFQAAHLLRRAIAASRA